MCLGWRWPRGAIHSGVFLSDKRSLFCVCWAAHRDIRWSYALDLWLWIWGPARRIMEMGAGLAVAVTRGQGDCTRHVVGASVEHSAMHSSCISYTLHIQRRQVCCVIDSRELAAYRLTPLRGALGFGDGRFLFSFFLYSPR